MKGEVETQFLLFGLLLHTQPLNSSEQHTRANLEFSSNFGLFFLTNFPEATFIQGATFIPDSRVDAAGLVHVDICRT